ncbi:MAG: hypothetical protein J0H68_05195 [Sphingobacteriia bacterium]|nr:hypothetical protein [Sphingobacteriia bacterium]
MLIEAVVGSLVSTGISTVVGLITAPDLEKIQKQQEAAVKEAYERFARDIEKVMRTLTEDFKSTVETIVAQGFLNHEKNIVGSYIQTAFNEYVTASRSEFTDKEALERAFESLQHARGWLKELHTTFMNHTDPNISANAYNLWQAFISIYLVVQNARSVVFPEKNVHIDTIGVTEECVFYQWQLNIKQIDLTRLSYRSRYDFVVNKLREYYRTFTNNWVPDDTTHPNYNWQYHYNVFQNKNHEFFSLSHEKRSIDHSLSNITHKCFEINQNFEKNYNKLAVIHNNLLLHWIKSLANLKNKQDENIIKINNYIKNEFRPLAYNRYGGINYRIDTDIKEPSEADKLTEKRYYRVLHNVGGYYLNFIDYILKEINFSIRVNGITITDIPNMLSDETFRRIFRKDINKFLDTEHKPLLKNIYFKIIEKGSEKLAVYFMDNIIKQLSYQPNFMYIDISKEDIANSIHKWVGDNNFEAITLLLKLTNYKISDISLEVSKSIDYWIENHQLNQIKEFINYINLPISKLPITTQEKLYNLLLNSGDYLYLINYIQKGAFVSVYMKIIGNMQINTSVKNPYNTINLLPLIGNINNESIKKDLISNIITSALKYKHYNDPNINDNKLLDLAICLLNEEVWERVMVHFSNNRINIKQYLHLFNDPKLKPFFDTYLLNTEKYKHTLLGLDVNSVNLMVKKGQEIPLSVINSSLIEYAKRNYGDKVNRQAADELLSLYKNQFYSSHEWQSNYEKFLKAHSLLESIQYKDDMFPFIKHYLSLNPDIKDIDIDPSIGFCDLSVIDYYLKNGGKLEEKHYKKALEYNNLFVIDMFGKKWGERYSVLPLGLGEASNFPTYSLKDIYAFIYTYGLKKAWLLPFSKHYISSKLQKAPGYAPGFSRYILTYFEYLDSKEKDYIPVFSKELMLEISVLVGHKEMVRYCLKKGITPTNRALEWASLLEDKTVLNLCQNKVKEVENQNIGDNFFPNTNNRSNVEKYIKDSKRICVIQ